MNASIASFVLKAYGLVVLYWLVEIQFLNTKHYATVFMIAVGIVSCKIAYVCNECRKYKNALIRNGIYINPAVDIIQIYEYMGCVNAVFETITDFQVFTNKVIELNEMQKGLITYFARVGLLNDSNTKNKFIFAAKFTSSIYEYMFLNNMYSVTHGFIKYTNDTQRRWDVSRQLSHIIDPMQSPWRNIDKIIDNADLNIQDKITEFLKFMFEEY